MQTDYPVIDPRSDESRGARMLAKVWGRRSMYFGFALLLFVAATAPFMAGFPLHKYFEYGRYLFFVDASVLTLLMFSLGMTAWMWYVSWWVTKH